jgi:peroxisomal enoyl-CoA hydratase 2
VNFTERIGGSNTIKGLPTFDPRRVVHASQTIEILKQLPPVSGPGWKLKKRLASIRENSAYPLCISCCPVCRIATCTETGVIIESEFLLVDSNDTPYTRLFVRT